MWVPATGPLHREASLVAVTSGPSLVTVTSGRQLGGRLMVARLVTVTWGAGAG